MDDTSLRLSSACNVEVCGAAPVACVMVSRCGWHACHGPDGRAECRQLGATDALARGSERDFLRRRLAAARRRWGGNYALRLCGRYFSAHMITCRFVGNPRQFRASAWVAESRSERPASALCAAAVLASCDVAGACPCAMASGTAKSAASRTAVVSKRVMASPREPGEHASGVARVHRAPRLGEPCVNYDNGMGRRCRPSVGSSGAAMRARVPRALAGGREHVPLRINACFGQGHASSRRSFRYGDERLRRQWCRRAGRRGAADLTSDARPLVVHAVGIIAP